MQSNPEPIIPLPLPTFSIWLLYFRLIFPVLITPGPVTKQLKTALAPHRLQLLKLAYPEPAYPISPILSHGNHNKGPSFPSIPSASLLIILVLLHGHDMPPPPRSFWEMWLTSYLFSDKSLLVHCPHQTWKEKHLNFTIISTLNWVV